MWIFVEEPDAAPDTLLIAVDKDSAPAEVEIEIGRIAVHAIIRTDLNESFVLHSQDGKNKEQFSVFLKLRKDPETSFVERGQVALPCHLPVLMIQLPLGNLNGRDKPVPDPGNKKFIFQEIFDHTGITVMVDDHKDSEQIIFDQFRTEFTIPLPPLLGHQLCDEGKFDSKPLRITDGIAICYIYSCTRLTSVHNLYRSLLR